MIVALPVGLGFFSQNDPEDSAIANDHRMSGADWV
jgi:hypothetical protein